MALTASLSEVEDVEEEERRLRAEVLGGVAVEEEEQQRMKTREGGGLVVAAAAAEEARRKRCLSGRELKGNNLIASMALTLSRSSNSHSIYAHFFIRLVG